MELPFLGSVDRNVLCGALFCDQVGATPVYQVALLGQTGTVLTNGGTTYNCNNAQYMTQQNGQNAGLVANGASCGASQVGLIFLV